MAWLELHQSLPTHRKTMALMDALELDVACAVGHLACLWLWALDNAPDGRLDVSARTIARVACWGGDPDAFVAALQEAGFLDGNRIHGWDDYAGRLLEHRRFEAERALRKRRLYGDETLRAEVRARDGDDCRYCGRTVEWLDRRSPLGGTYDHVDPDGPNTAANIVVCCRGCNGRKGRRTPERAGMRLLPSTRADRLADRLADFLPEICQKSALTVPNPTKPTETPTPPIVPPSHPSPVPSPRASLSSPNGEEGATRARAREDREPHKGKSLAPLADAFAALGTDFPPTRAKDEIAGAQALLRAGTPEEIAACWRAVADGEYGDAFDQRKLSFTWLAHDRFFENWRATRNGTYRPPQPAPRAAKPLTGAAALLAISPLGRNAP